MMKPKSEKRRNEGMHSGLSSRRAMVFQIVVSAAIGVGVVTIILIGGGGPLSGRILASGAIVGVSIWACCTALCHLWWSRLLALPNVLKFPAFGAVLLLGGVSGWVVSWGLNLWLLGVRYSSSPANVLISVAMTGAIAVVVGGAITTIQVLRERLEQKISELKEKEYTEKELQTAAAIQKRLLPPSEFEIDGLRLRARHIPARQVAGDFYDVFRAENGSVAVAIADVVGKGLGASLIMASVKATLPLVGAGKSVAETLRELNRRLVAELGPREFVAFALAHFDTTNGVVQLGNAGLPDPYLLQPGQLPKPLSVSGPRLPLGAVRDVEYEVIDFRWGSRDQLLLLTDGAPEALGANSEPIGYDRLEKMVAAADREGGLDLDQLVAGLRSATSDDVGDDWTFVSVGR